MLRKGDWLSRRYKVEEDPVIGAFSILYTVYDWSLDKRYIMVTPKDDRLKDEQILDFYKRASIWVELGRHCNLVLARETETIEGRPYLILEYVEGKSLQSMIHENKLTPAQSLNIAIQFCNGMEYVHNKRFKAGKGLVHRDIKPSNLMFTEGGILKITDFWMAKVRGVSSVEGPAGTPAYMSPEQFETMDVDARADIYSFGVVLFEMLTGRGPFPEPNQDRIGSPWDHYKRHHQKVRPTPPSSIDSSIPKELDRIVLRCLEKKPKDRYQDYADLRKDLSDVYRSFGEDQRLAILIAISWNNAGFSLMEEDKYEEALRHFLKALEYDADCMDALYNAGFSLMKLDRYEEAIQYMNKILRLDPSDEYARNARDACAKRIAPKPPETGPPELPSKEVGALIEVMSGPMDGTEIRLTKEVLNIGRRRDNDIILVLDPYVSRNHARIIFEDGLYWLEDLNSTNGTWKDGRRITKREKLKNGDMFRIGDTWLQIRM